MAKSIEEYAKSIQAFGFSIGSDYGPCKMLADAAAEAGIDRANFPFKTTMFFTEKEGVLVRMATVPRLSGFVEVTEW